MHETVDPRAQEVLSFWFGPLGPDGLADEAHRKRWYSKDDAFDAELRDRFGADLEAIVRGERESWLATPRGRLAAVIVLDQFSRNVFRGTPRMFAADEQALRTAVEGIERGQDALLTPDERGFLYMPLMHSENPADQDRCVALFEALRDSLDEPARSVLGRAVPYAERHREIVVRFGRFPHRNAVLGRTSTGEEMVFLKEPNSSF